MSPFLLSAFKLSAFLLNFVSYTYMNTLKIVSLLLKIISDLLTCVQSLKIFSFSPEKLFIFRKFCIVGVYRYFSFIIFILHNESVSLFKIAKEIGS
jgi:hypothetical protein